MGVARLLRRRPQRDYDAWVKATANNLLWWKCNEGSGNLADSSGNGYTGVKAGTITYSITGPFGGAKAVSFNLNTSSNYFRAAGMPGQSGSSTWEHWIYFEQAANDWMYTASCGYNSSPYIIGFGNNADQLGIDMSNGQGGGAAAAIGTGTWRLCTYIYNAAAGGIVKTYLDGVLKYDSTHASALTPANGFSIGFPGSNSNVTARFSHVAVYTRALSVSELLIRVLFAKGG